MRKNTGITNYLNAQGAVIKNGWKTLTAHIIRGIAMWCKNALLAGVYSCADTEAKAKELKNSIKTTYETRHQRLPGLARYNGLNKVIGPPARFAAAVLQITVQATFVAISHVIFYLAVVLGTVIALAILIGAMIANMGLIVKSLSTAVYTVSKNSAEKFLSRRTYGKDQTEQGEEECYATQRTRKMLTKTMGYTTAGMAALVMVFVIFPVALLSALVGFIPAIYCYKRSAGFRDRVVDALLLEVAYEKAESTEDLINPPAVNESLRNAVEHKLSGDLHKMSAQTLKDSYVAVLRNNTETYRQRFAEQNTATGLGTG